MFDPDIAWMDSRFILVFLWVFFCNQSTQTQRRIILKLMHILPTHVFVFLIHSKKNDIKSQKPKPSKIEALIGE